MGKAVEHVEDYTVLLSLHHVTPHFEDDVVRTCDMLSDLGISDYTLLVTPMYMMKKTNAFTRDSMFTQFLQSLDLEIALYGYTHRTKSGSSDEFGKISRTQAARRIKNGRALLQEGFEMTPEGFVPPCWAAPPLVSRIARELGFAYCVRGNTVDSIAHKKLLSVAARIISDGGRSLTTSDAMVEMQLGGSLQVGVHPLDHRNSNMFTLLADLKDEFGYKFVDYAGFLSR